jgi:hypothetical protein
MQGEELLRYLQEQAPTGFHRKLRAWVDDNSSVARVLREMDAAEPIWSRKP